MNLLVAKRMALSLVALLVLLPLSLFTLYFGAGGLLLGLLLLSGKALGGLIAFPLVLGGSFGIWCLWATLCELWFSPPVFENRRRYTWGLVCGIVVAGYLLVFGVTVSMPLLVSIGVWGPGILVALVFLYLMWRA